MNIWSQKTIEFAKTQDYLDQLQLIYPNEEGERDISQSSLDKISKLFNDRNEIGLINELLALEKFPYKDSYVGFLRKDRTAIARNPITVKRIVDRLYKMGLEKVLAGITAPKESNQMRGNQFRNWTFSNFQSAELEEFERSKAGILILNTSEQKSRDFCAIRLGIAFTKRPDLVAKVNDKYVVGEAKFSSESGGNQNAAFKDGIDLAMNSSGRAFKIFVLDGVIWLSKNNAQFNSIVHTNAPVFSAVFLREYLEGV